MLEKELREFKREWTWDHLWAHKDSRVSPFLTLPPALLIQPTLAISLHLWNKNGTATCKPTIKKCPFKIYPFFSSPPLPQLLSHRWEGVIWGNLQKKLRQKPLRRSPSSRVTNRSCWSSLLNLICCWSKAAKAFLLTRSGKSYLLNALNTCTLPPL